MNHSTLLSRGVFWGLLYSSMSAHCAVEGWVARHSGPGNWNEQAAAISLDADGRVYVAGFSQTNGTPWLSDFLTIGYSSNGSPLWTNRYDGGTMDFAQAIKSYGDSRLYVTGRSSLAGGLDDFATLAYSADGQPLWTNRYDGGSVDAPQALAIGPSGQVYVTGYSYRDTTNRFDFTTVAYNADGVSLWTNSYTGPAGDDQAAAVAVGSNGNVYVTGTSAGLLSQFDTDYATVAYSSSGSPLWTNRWSEVDSDYARAIAVDPMGNVVVTGQSWKLGSGSDFLTIAYSAQGLPLWTNRCGTGQSDSATAIAVGKNGNVYVTGGSSGLADYQDFLTVAYSPNGMPLWTNRYGGPGDWLGGFDDQPAAIAVDRNDNVYVTGRSCGAGGQPSAGVIVLGGAEVYDYATVAYSSSGIPLWTNRYNGTGNFSDSAEAVAVDLAGNVFVTGYSTGTWTNYDFATIKYTPELSRPALTIESTSTAAILSWTNAAFNLQSGPFPHGDFTNIPFATSPYTNPINSPFQFFRLKAN